MASIRYGLQVRERSEDGFIEMHVVAAAPV